ncbi:MAG TPA: hypothetical protein VFT60_11530 [Bryobacteraceae bacterium]|jgi:hypothetical protein|nr:hypothetical protein [Bryobacteraceae bacterium]
MPAGVETQTVGLQVVVLFLLAVPTACIAWTITHEEIFREPREFCVDRSRRCRNLLQRKFFYALTCEFCLSHYVAAAWLAITRFQLLFEGWRGYLIAWFSLVWIANVYMAIFGRLRLEIQSQRLDIEEEKRELGRK